MEIDVLTLFPDAFAWFERQRHVANALAAGSRLRLRRSSPRTPRWAPVRSTTRRSAAGRGWCCAST